MKIIPRTKTNPMAISSLIFSLVGFCSWLCVMVALLTFFFSLMEFCSFFGFFAILGVILGFLALNQIKKQPFRYTGKGFALAGIIIGFSVLILYFLSIILFVLIVFMIIGS